MRPYMPKVLVANDEYGGANPTLVEQTLQLIAAGYTPLVHGGFAGSLLTLRQFVVKHCYSFDV